MGDVLATEGLIWVSLAVTVAGLVRGFTGFGTALIVAPVAARYLPAEVYITIIAVIGLTSATVLVPRAWGRADRAEIGTITLAAVLCVPLGMALLMVVSGDLLRWVVSVVALTVVAALTLGFRHAWRPGGGGRVGLGAASGVLGGATGLAGPLMILFYLTARVPAAVVRANNILFLAALDVTLLVVLLAFGNLSSFALLLAAILAVPYVGAAGLGQALFRPEMERAYRAAAMAIVAGAVLVGLPIWD
ncbi:MAG: TSUP family transporter [Paracoccaceae bacterium]